MSNPAKEITVIVKFDKEEFMSKYESILMAIEDLYDLVPDWKEGLADDAKDKIIKEMICITIKKDIYEDGK